MGFFKRLFGGDERDPSPDDAAATPRQDAALDEAERERELLRGDPAQTSDELIQRQLRYADRVWTPPAQGGSRRADDESTPDS
jgi:hypothetical protein